MRTRLLALTLCCAAQPAAAQFTTTYAGMQLDNGKQIAASAQFSVEKGRIVAIMKGSKGFRMLFDEKAQVLRIISDDDKSYFDIDKKTGGSGDQMEMMQKQLEQMPKEQREMAEQMMKGMMSKVPPPLTYVWSKETQVIAGYHCTRVEGMRGDVKVTEYCGSMSDDFKLSEADRNTLLAMQGYLRNFLIMVKSSDESMRVFQWDTSVDGYPVLTRCYANGTMTLDLALQDVNRKPVPNDLFELPKGYKRIDLSSMTGRGR
jgi:uncharacterized protein DUF4412